MLAEDRHGDIELVDPIDIHAGGRKLFRRQGGEIVIELVVLQQQLVAAIDAARVAIAHMVVVQLDDGHGGVLGIAVEGRGDVVV